jgi:hypothetical protein
MANDEYRQLVEFLTREFGRVDVRFGQVDAQLVAVRREMGEMRRALRAEIHQQAETFEGKLADFRRDVDDRFDEVKGLIRLSHVDLDRRVRRLEDRR